MGRVGSTRDPSDWIWVKIFLSKFNRIGFKSDKKNNMTRPIDTPILA
jgi:hypothetical protein